MSDNLLPPVRNAQLLVDAMGRWPSFHDGLVLSSSRAGDRRDLLVYVFTITDEVDENGYFVVKDHHRVSLVISGIIQDTLPRGYDSDILFDLGFESSDEFVTITFESSMDKDGYLVCREVTVSSVASCGPKGEPIA